MRWIRPVFFLLVVLLVKPGALVFGAARDLFPNTPDEVILKRGAEQPKPLWQIPLGPALVEDMQSLGPGRLLVGLRKDFPGLPNLDYLLIDTDRGEILWRFSREKIKGEFDKLLVLRDLLLFRVGDKKATSLLALDTETGRKRWAVSFKGVEATFIPLLASASVLAVVPEAGSVELAALDLGTGREVWKRTIPSVYPDSLPEPLPAGEDVLVFFAGVERLSSTEGKTVFSLPETNLDPGCPPPQIEGDILWVVDSGSRLRALEAGSGRLLKTIPLPGEYVYTQIYPLGPKLFLRGINGLGTHFVTLVDPDAGQVLWTHLSPEPSISNLIDDGRTLYFGTPSSLVAINADDGKVIFSVQVTTTGRTFPVRIRKIGDRLLYIGELVAAAYEARTGKMVYRAGMTPGSEELHLNGLDAAAPNLKDALNEASKEGPGGREAKRMISFAARETMRYQNLARGYSSRATSEYSRGDVLGGDLSSMKATFARREAAFQATMAAALSITNVAMMYKQFLYARSIETFIERQTLFRKSILSSYAQSETKDYVYRPHLVYRDPMDTFSALSVIHLPTGRRSETILSPQYLSYGLWQVVDFEKGVVYHSSIGMDPARWELSEARIYYPYKKARTVNTFLIAQPVKLP